MQSGARSHVTLSGPPNWTRFSSRLSVHAQSWNRCNLGALNPGADGKARNNMYSHLRYIRLMIQEVKRVAARSTRGGNFSSVGLREETLPEQKSRWLGNPAADVLRVPRSWPRATRPTATAS